MMFKQCQLMTLALPLLSWIVGAAQQELVSNS